MPLHKNVVRLYDVFEPTINPQAYEELYYVFEAANTDLRKVITSSIPLHEIHLKVILF